VSNEFFLWQISQQLDADTVLGVVVNNDLENSVVLRFLVSSDTESESDAFRLRLLAGAGGAVAGFIFFRKQSAEFSRKWRNKQPALSKVE
jgi:hypothetical protein